MTKDLCIKLYPACGVENRPLLELLFHIEENISVPFGEIIYVLHCIFGEKCIITYNYL